MSGKMSKGKNTGNEDTRADSMYRASKNEFSLNSPHCNALILNASLIDPLGHLTSF